jgi:Flp pilus assembly protein TadD
MPRALPAPPPSAPARSWHRTPLFAALILAVAGVLAYHNSFTGPFVFDDEPSILANPTIRSLGTAWWPPTEGGLTVSGRPVLNFTLAINHAISGPAPWSYHGLNLLIHLAGGLVLFGLVRRTLLESRLAPRFGSAAREIAGVAAGLWLLHPLQTNAVTYVIQRAESLCGLFCLLTLYCFLRGTGSRHRQRWHGLAVLACVLGMGTKEVMATAPLMVLLYDRAFISGNMAAAWRQHRGVHLALAATWLVLLGLVLATDGRGGTAGFGTAITPLAYFLTQLKAVTHYLQLAVWPSPLVFDHGKTVAAGWTEIIAPALLLIPLFFLSLWGLWRNHPAGFSGIFFFAVLSPSSSFVPVATQTMAEHRMYLPLAALTTLAAAGAWQLAGRRGLATLGATAVLLGGLTIHRNRDFASAISLYEDTLAKVPGNARARALLADYYARSGRLDDARRELEHSLATEPGVPEVLNNLGNVWLRLGDATRAVGAFQQALALSPRDPEIINNLGNALLHAGREDEGVAHLETALRLAPATAATHFNLASALTRAGRQPEAEALLQTFIARHPDDADAHHLLGQTLLALGRRVEAIQQLEAAVRLQSNQPDFRNQLGIALGRAGRLPEALRQFEAALKLDPAHPTAAQNAALARQRLGRE